MHSHQKAAEVQAKILKLAEAQLLQNGYAAMSLGHIAGQLNLSPTTIQEYFPSKVDLGLYLLQRIRRKFKKWRKLPDQEKSTPYFKLVAFFQLYDNYQLQDQRMGFVSAISASRNQMPEPILTETQLLVNDQVKFLTKLLKEGKEKKFIKYKGKAKAKAGLILSNLIGNLMLSRVQGTELYEANIKQLLSELKA